MASDEQLNKRIFSAIEDDESHSDYLPRIAIAAAADELISEMFTEEIKSISSSEYYREEGNKAYKKGLLQQALVNYNQALAFAPNDSLCLKLAYSNRSAVFFSANENLACVTDCDKAIDIDCPTPFKIIEKLKNRKLQALDLLGKSNPSYSKDEIVKRFAENYFKLKSQNINIPCASDDVGTVIESQIPKLIAQKEIPAGTVVAVEKAFISWTVNEKTKNISCYYCCKLELNLFPCSGCVIALFCSKQCEESCLTEYHNVECQIIGKLKGIKADYKWILKAVIKLKNMCTSWQDFILISQDYGYNKLKKNTINEIFDGNNPSAVLSFRDDRHFLHGALYKAGILSGIVLTFLRNSTSFMPHDISEKMTAVTSMARVLMYLALYGPVTVLQLVTNFVDRNAVGHFNCGHRGLFTFAGKIRHSCTPNLQTVAVNSTMVLISVEPIKAGTELTVSQVCHWLETEMSAHARKIQLFFERGMVCTCFVCSATKDDWANMKQESSSKISAAQKKAAKDCPTLEQYRVFHIPYAKCFEQIYKALACLKDYPFSEHYEKVYSILISFQAYTVNNMVNNVILSFDWPNFPITF